MSSYHSNKNRVGPKWSKNEDESLIKGVQEYGSHAWDKVSRKVSIKSYRSPQMCENRFEKMKEAGFVKQPWTQEEDAIIERCIDEVSNQYT
jgi:hypothetical protein